MNVHRSVLTVTAMALLGSPSAALATPRSAARTVCQIITDREGDGTLMALTYGETRPANSPPMDILSADIATGATTVAAAIRVVSLDLDPQALPSVTYLFLFHAKNTQYTFSLVRDWQGGFGATFNGNTAKGSVDTATKTITFSADRKLLKGFPAKGGKLTELRARTLNGTANADTAPSAAIPPPYVDRTPSCLKPK